MELCRWIGATPIRDLGYAFAPAQLGNAVLTTQAVQHNADILFGGTLPSRRGCL